MRVLIHGPVTSEMLDDASMLCGIEATSFVSLAPTKLAPCEVMPPEPKIGSRRQAEVQRHYTLCQSADAVVMARPDDHLLLVATQYGLPVFEGY